MGLNLIPWAIAAVIAFAATGYVMHCEYVKKDHVQFIAQLKSDAEAQQRGIAIRVAREKALKEEVDHALENALRNLNATRQRLRDERARTSSVPTAPANASRPDLVCFDRAEFARAVDNFEGGMEAIAGSGAEAALNLSSARSWALKLDRELKGVPK